MTTWLFTSGVITAMQTYALLWFFARLFPARFRLPVRWLACLGLDAAVCLGINLLCAFVSDAHMAWPFAYTVALQFLLCAVLFGGDAYYKLFYILFSDVYFACILTISRFSAAALLAPGTLRTPTIYGLFVNVLPQGIAIAALTPLQRYTIRREFYLSPPRFYWFFIYFVYIAIYFGVIYITDTLIPRQLVTGLSILLQCALLLVIVSVYILFLAVCQSYHEKLQHSLIEKQYALQKAHFAEIQTANQALRELRHELKNYMFYMNYLIDQGNFDELRRFFVEFYQKEHHNLYEVSASGSFLDAALQQKVTAAEASGIEVEQHILLPEDGALDNLDLCIVLSNLIDNAAEACRELPNARIVIKLRRVKEYVSIVVENTTLEDVLKRNPQLRTGKRQAELHGIGLKVIRQIVERYDGSMQFESDDSTFRVMAMMRLPAQPKSEVRE